MTNKSKNINKESLIQGEFLKGARPLYEQSKEEVWAKMESRIGEKASTAKIRILRPVFAVAASVAVLLAITSFLRFYSVDLIVVAGKQLSHTLPDGSVIDINAESNLSYHPYWWRFSRNIKLEGEAYFEVEKGRKFQVISKLGTTAVLGTSFNIYSRESNYYVTCVTGKVRVSSTETSGAVILNPNEKASLTDNGYFDIQKSLYDHISVSWRDNFFQFTSAPIDLVLDELERQYNIVIQRPADLELIYTGNFKKEESVLNALNLICRPFGLNFEQKSETEFIIGK